MSSGNPGGARRRGATFERLALSPGVQEERFDRVTRLTRRIFGVRMAAITLVDDDRQWFTSCQGVDLVSLPRTVALTERALRAGVPFVVEDVQTDPRFALLHSEAIEQHGVRFFAAHPLMIGDEQLGALCLADEAPRRFTDPDMRCFVELAHMAERELNDSEELERAAAIQQTLLPRRPPQAPGWEFAALCLPARSVGGDFTDWRYREGDDDGGVVEMTIADVMGRGVGAGIVAATVRATMRTATRGSTGPTDTVARAAAALQEDLDRTGSLVTMMHAWLDTRTGLYRGADVGHGLRLVLRADGEVLRLTSGGLPLGVSAGETWTEQRVQIQPGDRSVAFSDGLLALYDDTRTGLAEIVRVVRSSSTGMAGVIGHFRELAGRAPLLDDVTAVGFRRFG